MGRQVTVIVEGRKYVVEVGDLTQSPIRATVNQRTYHVEVPGEEIPPAVQREQAPANSVESKQPSSNPKSSASSFGSTAITAPMPGNIAEIKVRAGDKVAPGDVICVLEAMKMNNKIHSTREGVIATVEVVLGQDVDYGAPLVTFE